MSLIQNHVLIETLKAFFMATAVILSVLLIIGGVQEGVRHGLPLVVTLRVIPFLVPEMLRFAVPGCLLFAICSTFGKLSANNEMLAVKSMGIHPLRVIWPALVLSGLLSVATYHLYDICATWSRPGVQRTLAQATDEIIYNYLQSKKTFSNQNLSIAVQDVEAGQLIRPVIHVHGGPLTQQNFTVAAEQASITQPGAGGLLRFTCYEGWVEIGEEATLMFDGVWHHDVVVPSPRPNDVNSASPASLKLTDLPAQLRRETGLLQKLYERPMDSGQPADEEQQASELRCRKERVHRLQAERQRRLANGFGCLCFALVGIPVAMWQRSSDTMGVFFMCFAPILLIYYPLLVFGEMLARDGVYPQATVWLADGVMLLAGTFLLHWQLRS